jgi:hypothetical protein
VRETCGSSFFAQLLLLLLLLLFVFVALHTTTWLSAAGECFVDTREFAAASLHLLLLLLPLCPV